MAFHVTSSYSGGHSSLYDAHEADLAAPPGTTWTIDGAGGGGGDLTMLEGHPVSLITAEPSIRWNEATDSFTDIAPYAAIDGQVLLKSGLTVEHLVVSAGCVLVWSSFTMSGFTGSGTLRNVRGQEGSVIGVELYDSQIHFTLTVERLSLPLETGNLYLVVNQSVVDVDGKITVNVSRSTLLNFYPITVQTGFEAVAAIEINAVSCFVPGYQADSSGGGTITTNFDHCAYITGSEPNGTDTAPQALSDGSEAEEQVVDYFGGNQKPAPGSRLIGNGAGGSDIGVIDFAAATVARISRARMRTVSP